MNHKRIDSILVKPAGPDCNMGCDYCFYLEKERLFPSRAPRRMSLEILEALIRQTMAGAGQQVSFGWQGGEPTLMGLEFFENVVALQSELGQSRVVGNGLQTNGLLIDTEWARFLAKYSFLVGLSIDGPEHLHDRHRKRKGGQGSWAATVERAKLMLGAGVAVNALTVVHDESARYPDEIYEHHKEIDLHHMQFIPLVEPDRSEGRPDLPRPVTAERFGVFLCRLFDLWCGDFVDGVPTTSIRFFDSLFHHYVGLQPPECTLLEECGNYLVVEHNGDVYACDFYVEPGWKLGNVLQNDLRLMLNSELQTVFGRRKADLSETCRLCRWLAACRGGCPRERLQTIENELHSRLCHAYKSFFEHADGWFRQRAEVWLREEQERRFEEQRRRACGSAGTARPGRNDPCPCGSGRKFKKCCGR